MGAWRKGGRPDGLRWWFWAACAVAVILAAHAGRHWLEEAPLARQLNPPRYAADPAVGDGHPVYRIAVHPLHNPRRLFANFQPVIDIVNRHARGFSVRLIAGRDYQSFERRLFSGECDMALANPLQTLFALERGYRVVGKMGDDHQFRGIIVTRRDTDIDGAASLAGREAAFPSPTALAATLMPRLLLHDLGADLSRMRVTYGGSQESAIMLVYLGKADLAGTWPMPWELFLKERPELAERLQVRWWTDPLINNGIVARRDMPEEHVRIIMEALLGLESTDEGREALRRISLSRFEAADDESYARPVRRFLDAYDRAFPGETEHLPWKTDTASPTP